MKIEYIQHENHILLGLMRMRFRLPARLIRKILLAGLEGRRLSGEFRHWPELADRLNSDVVERASAIAEQSWVQGIRSIDRLDRSFPENLLQISSCPPVLFYRGRHFHEIMNVKYKVCIVGSRMPTSYGRKAASEISADLVRQGIAVISGLALGIDGTAHQAALDAGGWTIAVVANGPDVTYPKQHTGLMRQIVDQGLVISEYPPGIEPRRQHFPARNRLLSGLADIVAVIEATRKSGTMITAGFAADQGREVFAVPGSIYSPLSQGCNQLIEEGAGILLSTQNILDRLAFENWQIACSNECRGQQPP